MIYDEFRRFVSWPKNSISFQGRNNFAATSFFKKVLRHEVEHPKTIPTTIVDIDQKQPQQSTKLQEAGDFENTGQPLTAEE